MTFNILDLYITISYTKSPIPIPHPPCPVIILGKPFKNLLNKYVSLRVWLGKDCNILIPKREAVD